MSDGILHDEARGAEMATFDETRDGFLDAYATVPDDALSYLPPGDEYALGALPIHVCDSMDRYLAVLDRVTRANYGPLDLGQDAAMTAMSRQQHERMLQARPSAAERTGLVAAVRDTHERLRRRLDPLSDEEYRRSAPVIYDAGGQPYPTSAELIVGWLTDHYREHIQQIEELLARRREGQEG
jgi:hypothetical protein